MRVYCEWVYCEWVYCEWVYCSKMTTITPRIELERDYAQAIVETVREPLVILDADLRVLTANRSFYKIFHVNKYDTEKN